MPIHLRDRGSEEDTTFIPREKERTRSIFYTRAQAVTKALGIDRSIIIEFSEHRFSVLPIFQREVRIRASELAARRRHVQRDGEKSRDVDRNDKRPSGGRCRQVGRAVAKFDAVASCVLNSTLGDDDDDDGVHDGAPNGRSTSVGRPSVGGRVY